MKLCRCAERFDAEGNRLTPLYDFHRCDYVAARNRLIPEAHTKAMALAGSEYDMAHSIRFTKYFSQTMDRLAAEIR